MEELESEHRQWDYILGVRMRKAVEVEGEVLGRTKRYQVLYSAKEHSTSPSPLKVKEVNGAILSVIMRIRPDRMKRIGRRLWQPWESSLCGEKRRWCAIKSTGISQAHRQGARV
jgi:hypothetical protein